MSKLASVRLLFLCGFGAAFALGACTWNEGGSSSEDALKGAPSLQIASDGTTVTFTVSYSGTPTSIQLFVDDDRSATTGYSVGGLGAGLLVENGGLYRYAGSGTDWSWTLVKRVTFQPASGTAVAALPRSDLGTATSIDAVARTSPPQRVSAKVTQDLGTATDAGTSTSGRTVTFSPTVITADAPELVNALRGQYRWLGAPPYPAGSVDNDSYQRWSWVSFEPKRGTYNWAMIDNELAAARTRHGRFGMRLMPLCQGCESHTYNGARSSIPDDLAGAANSLIGTAPGDSTPYVLPDWNSTAYLDRLAEVLNAIGAHYHDDPTFAFVDVTGYGNWGEFHLYPFNQPGGPYDSSTQRPITDANARRIVQINAAAFPNKLLVQNVSHVAAVAEAVATVSPKVGFRTDCLGSDALAGGTNILNAVPGALDHWRTAPYVTEWCQYNLGSSGANLFVQGEAQVRQYHVSMLSSGNFNAAPSTTQEVDAFRKANVESGYRLRTSAVSVQVDPAKPGEIAVSAHWVDDDVAPTYLAWRVVVGLRGTSSVESPLNVDLRAVMPDAPVDDTEVVKIGSLPTGTYEVYLRVEDVQGISPPMFLAMQGRDSAGNYVLGNIGIP